MATTPGPVLAQTPSNISSADGAPREKAQQSADDLKTSREALGDLEKGLDNDPPEQPADQNFLVEFDGPDDPDNPKNWSTRRRWAITISMGLLVFTVTFASSIFSVNIGVVSEKFNVSVVTATLGVALFVLVSGHGIPNSIPIPVRL